LINNKKNENNIRTSHLVSIGYGCFINDNGQVYCAYYSEIYDKFVVADDKVSIADFILWMALPPFPKT
jgi:hypothetical protein